MMNMAFPDRRTLNVLLTTLLFAVVLAIVYVARAVIVIFAFSILFAYLINPIVRFLQRYSLFFKNLRGPHVAEAYLALLISCVARCPWPRTAICAQGRAVSEGMADDDGKRLFRRCGRRGGTPEWLG